MGAPGEGEAEQVLPGFLEHGSEGSKPRVRGRTELLLLLPFVHFAISWSACFLTVETQNFHKLWKLWQKRGTFWKSGSGRSKPAEQGLQNGEGGRARAQAED